MSQEAVSFGEDLVRSLSRSLNEPDWLTASRLEACRSFIELPLEINPLYTKYVSTFGFPVDQFRMTTTKSRVDFRSFFGDYLTGKETDIILQGNETQVHAELDDELASKV